MPSSTTKKIPRYRVTPKQEPRRYRTILSRPLLHRMIVAYGLGFSLRELAHRCHYAIPIVKRSLLAAGVKLKHHGRPRKEEVA